MIELGNSLNENTIEEETEKIIKTQITMMKDKRYLYEFQIFEKPNI